MSKLNARVFWKKPQISRLKSRGIPLEGKRVTRSAKVGQAEESLNASVSPFIDSMRLNILYTNADCFCNKRDDLSPLLGTLHYRPSVIVITEVNSKYTHNNLCERDFNLVGFNLY